MKVMLRGLMVLMALGGVCGEVVGQTIYDWADNAPDNNWRQGASGARWFPGGLFNEPGFGVLRFNNNHQNNMQNNVPGTYGTHGFIFGAANSTTRTINGNSVRFFDNSGNNPYVQNESTADHSIEINIEGDGDGGDPLEIRLNSVGDLTFGGTINNQGSNVNLIGSAASTTTATFNGVMSGAGGFYKENGNIVAVMTANNTYSGQTTIQAGTLRLSGSGSLGSSDVRLHGGAILDVVNNASVASVAENNGGNSGTISLGSGATLSFIGADRGTLSQNSISGAGNLTMNGSGNSNLTLFGTQSYTGVTTINGGTLTTGVDLASSEIVVNNGGTFIVSGSIEINNLTINSGGTVIITSTGNLTVNGNAVMTGGTFTLSDEFFSSLNLAQNFTKTGGIFNANGSQVQFMGTNDQVFISNVTENLNTVLNNNGSAIVFLNSDITINTFETLQLNGSSEMVIAAGASLTMGQSASVNFSAGSSLTVHGTLRNTGTLGATINSTAPQLVFTSTGTYDHNMTRGGIAGGAAGRLGTIPEATWNPSSTCLISGLTNPNAGGWFTGADQTFSNFTWNTPSMTTSPNMAGATLEVNDTYTMLSTGSGEVRWGTSPDGILNCAHLVMSGGIINLSAGAGSGTINCSNSFTKTGGTLNLSGGTGVSVGTLNCAGSFVHSGGTITESGSGSGIIVFSGSVLEQTINTTGGNVTNTIHHRFTNPAGYNLTGSITVNSGSFVSMRAGTFSGAGTFNYNGTSSLLIYDGSSPISTTNYELPATNGPVSLELNNAGGDITLHDNRSLPNSTNSALTLTNGRLILGSNNLELLRPNTAALTTGNDASYIIQNSSGRLIRNISTGASIALFPLGETAGYTPFEIALTANNTARSISVEMFDVASPDINTPNVPPDYLERYFVPELNPSTGTYSYRINKLGYLAGDVVGTAAELNVSTYESGAWNDLATTAGNPLDASAAAVLTQGTASLVNRTFTGRNSSAKYTWNGSASNSWDNPLNWTPNGFPSPTDEVTIDVPGTNQLSVGDAKTIKNVIVTGTGVLNVAGTGELTVLTDFETSGSAVVNLAANSILNIAGTYSYSAPSTANFDCSSTVQFTSSTNVTVPPLQFGNLVLTGGARTLPSSGTLSICGNYTAVATASTTVTGSTVRFNGTTAQTIAGVATRFGTLEIANTSASVTPTVGTSVLTALTVNNNARLDITTGITLTLTGSSSVVNGFLRSSGTIAGASAATLTFGLTGTYEHNHGNAGAIPLANWTSGSTCAVIGASTGTSAPTNLNQTFHNFTWDRISQSHNINMLGNLTTVNGDLRIVSTGSGDLRNTAGTDNTLTVGGSFIMTDGIFNLRTGTAIVTMLVAGNFSLNGGTFTRTNTGSELTIVEFNGTLPQTISIASTAQIENAVSFRINNNSGVTLSGSTSLPINNNAILFRTLGTITGSGVITYSGATTTLTYDGSAPLSTSNKEWPATDGPRNVTLNSTAPIGGTGVTLHASRELPANGTLTLTTGKLTLGNNSLSLLNSAPTALDGGSPSAFVATSGNGQLIRTVATGGNTYLFPIGNGSNYNPASFVFNANNTTRQLGVRAPVTTHPNMAPNPSVYIQNVHWLTTLSPSTGTYSYTPSFTFINPDQVAGTDPAADLSLARWNGVVWSNVSEVATVPPVLTSPSLDQGNGGLNGAGWTGRKQQPPTVYTWTLAGNGAWTTASNWTPIGVPTTGDEVQFTHAASYSVSNVPVGITLRKMSFSGGGTTTLTVNTAGAVSFKGGINPVFDVASGTNVVVSGNNPSDWIIENGATGNVEGTVRLRGLSSTTPHTLQAADAGALRFKSGSYFAAGVVNTTNFSGNPFGNSGTQGTVIFESGSIYEHFDGANPFGLSQPQSKVIFETGSLYRYSDNSPNVFALPSITGRTYANFEYNSTQSKVNSSGISSYTMDDLTVSQGNYAIDLDANGTIRGDITVAAGSTLSFTPPGINRVITLNGIEQNINTNGTGILEVNGSGNGFTVASGTTVNMVGESTVTGTGRFTLSAGATLGIESALGIAAFPLAEGNIQTTIRSFATAANYVYQRNGDQITGLGMPAGIVAGGSITIASTGTVTHSRTTASTPILNLNNGLFDNTGSTITILSGGTLNATSGDFTPALGGGIVGFNAGATSNVNATGVLNFNNVNLVGGTVSGVNFGATGTPIIHGDLTINAGRFIDTNAPVYASGSTLIYNAVGTYGRGVEWGTTSGRGFPHNVTLSGSTTLQPGANGNQNTPMAMGGNLTINTGSNMYLDFGSFITTQDLVVPGNVQINGNGQLSLSTSSGDLRLGGNWTRSNTSAFNPNQRAVITNGTSDQIITLSGTEVFNYLVNIKPSGDVVLGPNTNLNINGNVGNVLVLNETSNIDLNGRTLNVNSPSGTLIQLPNIGVANVIGSANSRFVISAGNKEIGSIGGTLNFAPEVIVELQSGLDCGTDLTTVEGILQISSGGFVDVRAPYYPPGSTLRYATGGLFGRGAEWNTLTGTGFPYNVEVIQNVTPTIVNLFNGVNTVRRIAGNLTLNNGGTLNMDDLTSQLQVLGNVHINSGGTLNLGNNFQGDITIAGDLTRVGSGVLNQNTREIIMNGTTAQTITGVPSIDFLGIDNDGSEVRITANTTINNRLRLTRGLYNMQTFSNTMANGSEIYRQAATATMSGPPTVTGSNSYDLRYSTESFSTGVEFISSITAIRDLIIEGVTTTLGDSRTFNRSLFLNGANLNLNGNVLNARGRGATASGQIVANQAGVRNISGAGRFDIVGLGGNDPIARTKQFVRNNGATLVFGPNVEVRIGDGGCDFGAGNPVTIEGILSVRGGGYVIENAVNYAENSLLRFSNGFDYQVDLTDLTWAFGDITNNDPGIPYNVEVLFNTPNNTELVLNTPRALRNDLNIDGGIFTLTSDAGTFRIGGTWSRTGASSDFTHNEQEVIFDGFDPVVQTITTDVGTGEVFHSLSFENSAAKSLGEDVNVLFDLNIRSGSGVLSGSTHNLRIGRAWINEIGESAFNEETSTVIFNGTTVANRIISPIGGETFYNLNVLNSDSGLYIHDDVRIANTMGLIDGVVVPEEDTEELVFLNGASWSDASDASFAAGWVRGIGFDGTAYKEYPTGYLNTDESVQVYMPAGVRAVTGSSTAAYRVRYFQENHNPALTTAPGNSIEDFILDPLETISTCNWWDVERVEGSINANVRLYYDSGSGCYDLSNITLLTVARFNGSDWVSGGGEFASGDVNSGYVQAGPFSSFSPFTIGSTGPGNALPITLLSFSAEPAEGPVVNTAWSTASEINNDFFTVERSADAERWEAVGTVDGAGNSNTVLHYTFADDAPHKGLSYYRLRQTDFDGTTTTSQVEAVYVGDDQDDFALVQVYRSDAGLDFRYKASAPYLTLEVYDLSGRLIHGGVHANDEGGLGRIDVNLARGVYVLKLSDNYGNVGAMRFFW